jgi:hypothetical protein
LNPIAGADSDAEELAEGVVVVVGDCDARQISILTVGACPWLGDSR